MVRGSNDKLVVLSHAFWQRQFGGAQSVIGQRLNLGGESYEVVGVMPDDFRFPSPHVEVYIPYSGPFPTTRSPEIAGRESSLSSLE